MKKVLILPLLDSLPSGHHQVANALTNYISNRTDDIKCKKVDLLHHWNPLIEQMMTKIYLKWIQAFPKSYAFVYKKLAYSTKRQRSYKHYELIFLNKMHEIINEEKPDLIICTHAFPSYLVNKLKLKGLCSLPIMNVYTDFFINDLWGKDTINYHFVSNKKMERNLVEIFQILSNQIYMTGIPIDESFYKWSEARKENSKVNVLVAGGSAGLGDILNLLESSNNSLVNYYILCGNNKRLYYKIKQLNKERIHPLPYIKSRKKMNDLYNAADAIITKPGGVTISEAINKGIPIFIHSALPGQEEVNLSYLLEKKLVYLIDKEKDLTDQLVGFFYNEIIRKDYERSVAQFRNDQICSNPNIIYSIIEKALNLPKTKVWGEF